MAEYTQNYKLKKPLPNEFYDVADQNGNMDKIDSTLKKHDDLLDKKVDLDETGKIPQDQLPELDFIPNDEKGQPNGVAELDENGNLKLDQFPELNFDPAGSAATVQGNLNAHINNKQNPHGVTAAQVGAYTKTETNNLINAGKVPTGSILWFATNNAPSGFLACNGANISRTTYAGLFSIIGVAFGAGDGSTTFALPNLINKFIKGSNTVGAKNDGTFLTVLPNRTTGQNVIANTMVNNAISSSSTTYTTNNTSTYNEGDNISATKYYIQPPNITLKAFIKY